MNVPSLQMTVSLPFLHIQEHLWGHSGAPGVAGSEEGSEAGPLSERSTITRRKKNRNPPGPQIRSELIIVGLARNNKVSQSFWYIPRVLLE